MNAAPSTQVGVNLSCFSFESLRGAEWMEEMVILVYLQLVGLHLTDTPLTERHQRPSRGGKPRRAVALFPSGVAAAAVRYMGGGGQRGGRVEGQLKSNFFDIPGLFKHYDWLVFLVNPVGNHWMLIAVDMRGGWTSARPVPIHVYDSRHHLNTGVEQVGAIVLALQMIIADHTSNPDNLPGGAERRVRRTFADAVTETGIPTQKNADDCGVFAAHYARQLHLEDAMAREKGFDAQAFRLAMAETIAGGEVPPDRYFDNEGTFDIQD